MSRAGVVSLSSELRPGVATPSAGQRIGAPRGPSFAAAADLLLLCLRDDQDIWDALGTPGVRGALRPRTIVVNHGTGDPGENRRIAADQATLDVVFLDAPVSGAGAGARARAVTTMVGGEQLLDNAMTMSNLLPPTPFLRP